MFTSREDVQPDFLGLPGDDHRGPDAIVLCWEQPGGRIPGDVPDREDPELHPRHDINPLQFAIRANGHNTSTIIAQQCAAV
jgi:hypothetical protein